MSSNATILGLELESKIPDSVIPYCAIAIVKAFDGEDETYAVVMTENMTPVEGAGLIAFGQVYINEILRKTFKVDKNNRPPKEK